LALGLQAIAPMQYVGIDLAWSERNPSGIAAIDSTGKVVRASANLRAIEEICKFAGLNGQAEAVVAIDAPLVVNNPRGSRPVDKELTRAFWPYDAAPYPANVGQKAFQKDGHVREFVNRLRAWGFRHLPECDNQQRQVVLEVFPSPAQVILFPCQNRLGHLHGRALRYKHKQRRSWGQVQAEWEIYRARLRSLRYGEPPITFAPDVWSDITTCVGIRFKHFDDLLDGIFCAYLAYCLWTFGEAGRRVVGDVDAGYVVLPRCQLPQCSI
jgi:predicted RNase H-like nuclease